jgi:hypothetical protein
MWTVDALTGRPPMPTRPTALAALVKILERKVERLEQLPGRLDAVESQILQFRKETRAEFSTVRGEMRELHGIAMTRMDAMRESLSAQMRTLHEEVLTRIALLNEDDDPGGGRNDCIARPFGLRRKPFSGR